jgi:hypothetical protein
MFYFIKTAFYSNERMHLCVWNFDLLDWSTIYEVSDFMSFDLLDRSTTFEVSDLMSFPHLGPGSPVITLEWKLVSGQYSKLRPNRK